MSVSGLSWTYVDGRTLADGDYNYQLRVIDDAGNISATTSQVVTIDTVAPDASKTIAIDSISDDTGLSSRYLPDTARLARRNAGRRRICPDQHRRRGHLAERDRHWQQLVLRGRPHAG